MADLVGKQTTAKTRPRLDWTGSRGEWLPEEFFTGLKGGMRYIAAEKENT